MWNFTNDAVNGDKSYRYSRYIASWTNVCTKIGQPTYFDDDFEIWLKKVGVPDEDIINICEMARCGKMELELSATIFMKFLDGLDEAWKTWSSKLEEKINTK